MPPLSNEEYQILLQRITALETKVNRIEVNVEVNELCGNDTTLSVTRNSGQDRANAQLTCTGKATKKQKDCVQGSDNPPWNRLGAKPKRLEKGGRITGRAEHHEMTDLDSASSTPVPRRPQPWIAVNGRRNNKLPQRTSVLVSNRFTPLLQVPEFPSDDLDNTAASHRKVRPESQEPQRELTTGLTKLTTGPENLIVGDFSVRDMKSMFSVDTTKVLCYPNDMVSDLEKRILDIAASHTTVKNIILHIGSNDVAKQESEMLKQDFKDLLNTVSSLNAEVYISGPLPPIRRGLERFTRLLALNTWLSAACPDHSVHFIDNFNTFWNRRQFFKTDGLCLNKTGLEVFISNVFYVLRHSSVRAKDKILEKAKTQQCSSAEGQLPAPDDSSDHERYQGREEGAPPIPVSPGPHRSSPSRPLSPPFSPTPTLSSSSPELEFMEIVCTPRPRRPSTPPQLVNLSHSARLVTPPRTPPLIPPRRHRQPSQPDEPACLRNKSTC